MTLNPDDQLARIRRLADLADRTTDTADLDAFTDAFRDLDAHLTAGGTPPEAWREGPDAPGTDDNYTDNGEAECEHCTNMTNDPVRVDGGVFCEECAPDPADREPSPDQERAWDLREDDARGHTLI